MKNFQFISFHSLKNLLSSNQRRIEMKISQWLKALNFISILFALILSFPTHFHFKSKGNSPFLNQYSHIDSKPLRHSNSPRLSMIRRARTQADSCLSFAILNSQNDLSFSERVIDRLSPPRTQNKIPQPPPQDRGKPPKKHYFIS
jgi:hypothetical protein